MCLQQKNINILPSQYIAKYYSQTKNKIYYFRNYNNINMMKD